MAYKPLYLEPSEEITSVIDKIAQSGDKDIVLVLSKNSALFQSLVNLKLLAKEAKRLGKNVAFVSTNKIGQRLAKQVGINTYATIAALPAIATATTSPPAPSIPDEVIGGVKVQQYDPNRQHLVGADTAETPEEQPGAATPIESEETVIDNEPIKAASELTDQPASNPSADNASSQPDEDLPSVISRSGFSTRREVKIPWRSVAIGGGIFLVICLLGYIFVPRATVIVTFPAEPLSQTVAISAVTATLPQGQGNPEQSRGATNNQKANIITGNKLLVSKEKTKQITATGKKDIGTKATGTITITNKYRDGGGVGKDQTFPAGAKATEAASKKVFTLSSAVTVGKVTYDPNNGQPIYKSQAVGVTAIEPGESYNLAAGSFSVEGALSDTPASSAASMAGGLAKVVNVLAQDDVDTTILALKKEARDEAVSELKEKAAGQKLLEDSIWETISQEGADKAVGSQTDTAIATVAIEYGVITFDEKAANLLFSATFEGKVSESQEVVFAKDSPPSFKTIKIGDDKNSFDFEIAGTGYVVPKIDKVDVARKVKHQSTDAVAQLLKDAYGADSAEVTITPSWWIDRLPLLRQAITVEYGFLQKTDPVAPPVGEAAP